MVLHPIHHRCHLIGGYNHHSIEFGVLAHEILRVNQGLQASPNAVYESKCRATDLARLANLTADSRKDDRGEEFRTQAGTADGCQFFSKYLSAGGRATAQCHVQAYLFGRQATGQSGVLQGQCRRHNGKPGQPVHPPRIRRRCQTPGRQIINQGRAVA